MSKIGTERPKEYSDKFDELRQNRVELSYHKYGTAEDLFNMGLVDALGSVEQCVKKYKDTGNMEHLCDAANYLMFEFMYPQREGGVFKTADSDELNGIRDISVNESKEDEPFDFNNCFGITRYT